MLRLLLSGALLITVIVMAFKQRSSGLVLIAAGGLSNFLERFLTGQIVDNLHLGQLDFNVADIVIAAGVTLVIIHIHTN